jgi:hypothetical protein
MSCTPSGASDSFPTHCKSDKPVRLATMTARDATTHFKSYKFTRAALSEEINMEDFPIWLKLVIWGTMGLTVAYTLWGVFQSTFLS